MALNQSRSDVDLEKQPFQLLLSVIRSLSISENEEAREEERKKLEKEFQKSDAKLNQLVASGEKQIRAVMQKFSEDVGDQMSACKSAEELHRAMLTCKVRFREQKDHIRQLHHEGQEQEYHSELLDSIIWLKESPQKVDLLLKEGKYEEVAERLVAACKLGEGPLKQLEPLRDVQAEVNRRRSHVQERILADLHCQLYEKSMKDALDRRKKKIRNLRSLQPIFQGSVTGDGEDFKRSSTAYLAGLQKLIESDTKLLNPSGSSEYSSPALVAGGKAAQGPSSWEDVLGEIAGCLVKLGAVPAESGATKGDGCKELVEVLRGLGHDLSRELVTVVRKIGDEVRQNPCPKVDVVIQCCNGIPGGSASDMVLDDDVPFDATQQTQVQVVGLECPPLIDFFSSVFHAFHAIALRHKVLLDKFCKASRGPIDVYDLETVWSEIQAVVRSLLSDYLDMQNFHMDAEPGLLNGDPSRGVHYGSQVHAGGNFTLADINGLFLKKRINPKETQDPTLFSFDKSVEMLQSELSKNSQRAMFSSALSQGRMMPRQDSLVGDHVLLCKASPKNIALLYDLVSDFVKKMEADMGYSPGGGSCFLALFVTSCIEKVLIPQVGSNLHRTLDRSASKSPDIWRDMTTPAEQKKYRLDCPVLRSTVTVVESIKIVMEMVERLWLWRESFAEKTYEHLKQYFETCQAAYRGLTQPESEDKRIRSAVLAQDDDLARRLKSYPSWNAAQRAEAMEPSPAAATASSSGKKDRKSGPRSIGWQQNSARLDLEDLWQREAEILLSMAGGLPTRASSVSTDEILSDISQLKSLALLEESMAYFSGEIVAFVSFLDMVADEETEDNAFDGPGTGKIRPDRIQGSKKLASFGDELKSLAKDFQDLADVCLLVLHLEVRVHCMYFLFPLITGGAWASMGDKLRVDEMVVNLNRDLHAVHEALCMVLPPAKTQYILGGLGQMMSTILVRGLQCIPFMEATGIRRMSRDILSLHQNLCNLTQNPELALDRARLYYEMLHLSPHEILARIRRQGPKFTEAEYLAAFNVLEAGRGMAKDNSRLRHYKQQLSEILGEVGVTV